MTVYRLLDYYWVESAKSCIHAAPLDLDQNQAGIEHLLAS